LKTTLTTTNGYGRDLIDAVQMALRDLKEVGMEVELKLQEYGAYQATTGQGKFEGMAMVKEQRRTKDPEVRKQLIFAIQRYAAEQQYYIYLSSQVITASWQPYVKNDVPNLTSDFGSRVAALWLDR
jgi:ABC-type transport system substrate-binding protein